ncbi:MAG: glycerol-3-phosphate acyltransferase [Acidobacteriia bacterium]|nr:glycerol-3-phosphate acyltransferase [Terriglobia bacterium]
MPDFIKIVLLLVVAYGLGCISTGYYVVRLLAGRDLRTLGSASTGALNASRILGKKGFVLTFLGDTIKGAVAMGIGVWMRESPRVLVGILLVVVLGHIWPVQLHFHGGRGLATALGAGLVFDYRLTLVVGLVALVLALITRQYNAGVLIAMAISPLVARWRTYDTPVVVGFIALAVIIWIAHWPHLVRMASEIRTGLRRK